MRKVQVLSGRNSFLLFALIIAALVLSIACEQPGGSDPVPVITINKQPAPSTAVIQGSITGTLSVVASVTEGAALSYQWYSNTNASNSGATAIAINGQTRAAYAIPTNLTAKTYYYYCVVSAKGGADPVKSNVATVKVNPAVTPSVPVITINRHPASNTIVTQGSITGSLNVSASATEGAALSYQWYSNTTNSNSGGTAIAGQTGASYTIPANLTAKTYYYYCVVSATGGAVSKPSGVAAVTVNPVTPSVPEDPVTPSDPVIKITGQPEDKTVTQGSIYGAYLSVYASVTERATLSYQWYSNTNTGNSGGTAISGQTRASYTIPASLTAKTYYYYCVVSATGGADPVRSRTAVVKVNEVGIPSDPVITISKDPAPNTALIQGSITGSLSVEASVTLGATLSYQWYSNTYAGNYGGTAISGETSASYTIPVNLTANTYYYYCVVSATDGALAVRSGAAVVNVYTSAETETEVVIQPGNMNDPYLITQTATAYSNLNRSFTVSGTDYTAYQWYVDGVLLETETSATYTFNRPKGTYELVVVVTKSGGLKYSGRCRVIVE